MTTPHDAVPCSDCAEDAAPEPMQLDSGETDMGLRLLFTLWAAFYDNKDGSFGDPKDWLRRLRDHIKAERAAFDALRSEVERLRADCAAYAGIAVKLAAAEARVARLEEAARRFPENPNPFTYNRAWQQISAALNAQGDEGNGNGQ